MPTAESAKNLLEEETTALLGELRSLHGQIPQIMTRFFGNRNLWRELDAINVKIEETKKKIESNAARLGRNAEEFYEEYARLKDR